ncbi:ADP-ribosylglycohydrolase family protein [Capnocytophaga sp. 051621]|jgi:ADP-ribosylglycohydrolase family protein|uniref:ADP-ribosylglycohydrolase family protein n=2 Tax=Capnocytophaga TaxID=1016 RepID=A0ABS1YZ87_9FLAO|nr:MULTISPECIES: ADP-ribosylglycohydrolase family protein [Capnocytophaga]MBI1648087.1 ADP-ribosylglycohydrolase family protein [Capnocytophaga periodontitidis]MBM0651709.1 ADP-ribosylglycohydrolase family protein [Capnocytophaga genosp. AHN8471]MBM0663124.1 ADP-ribosylglycohydrolase family protein [Capnocytophaga genosp. AHN8471]
MKQTILGAIAGDVIGSVYEFNNTRTTDFPLFKRETTFTDDTVMTIAIADAILHNKDFAQTILDYGKRYPNRGYGTSFFKWLAHDTPAPPYNSWGNGSAMRVSAVGFAYNDLDTVLKKAEKTAVVTHNHPEGIKGAQATAAAIFLARTGKNKAEIKAYIEQKFGYDLDFTLDEIRPTFPFDESCQGTVPQSIVAFSESTDYDSAIRLAISLGGDSDTIACITGGIAIAFYKEMSQVIVDKIRREYLPPAFVTIIDQFDLVFNN